MATHDDKYREAAENWDRLFRHESPNVRKAAIEVFGISAKRDTLRYAARAADSAAGNPDLCAVSSKRGFINFAKFLRDRADKLDSMIMGVRRDFEDGANPVDETTESS